MRAIPATSATSGSHASGHNQAVAGQALGEHQGQQQHGRANEELHDRRTHHGQRQQFHWEHDLLDIAGLGQHGRRRTRQAFAQHAVQQHPGKQGQRKRGAQRPVTHLAHRRENIAENEYIDRQHHAGQQQGPEQAHQGASVPAGDISPHQLAEQKTVMPEAAQ